MALGATASRIALVAVSLGVGTACPCPPATCPSTLVLSLRFTLWEPGTYAVSVDGDGVALTCSLTVRTEGAGPLTDDIRCGDAIAAGAYLLDTGGSIVPDLVELTASTGDAQPVTLTLEVTHDAGDGPVALLATTATPTWRRRPETQRVCVEDCRTGRVAADVPAR